MNWMNIIVNFVFWYPAFMSVMWVIGSIIFYFRIERKKPLELLSTPKVSVLVPCYNEQDNIAESIERLNKLDYPDYEIVVIDDGSDDKTWEILNELAPGNDKLRIVRIANNSGKANALYHGLLVSQGEILVCVDADSYLAEDALKYMIPHFVNPRNGERVGAVTGNPRVKNRSSLLSRIQLCEYASIISLIKRTQRTHGKIMTVSGVIAAFRKRALLDCDLWDKDIITEDVAVTWKLEKNFWDVRFEPRAICWMLVPETVKGLIKQRHRWTRGGIEVVCRHLNIFTQWKERRLIPVCLEQIISTLWAVCWLFLFILSVISFIKYGTFMPYYWKSQFLSFICVIQFFVAMKLDKRYDKTIMKYCIWVIWYPILYWYINALVVLASLPITLLSKKKKYAVWKSPDRGLEKSEKEGSNDGRTKSVG